MSCPQAGCPHRGFPVIKGPGNVTAGSLTLAAPIPSQELFVTTSPTSVSTSSTVSNLPLAELDPEIAAVLDQELGRQRGTLEMIASENFAPRAVMEAQGSVLTNKYAEGYPGRRYYGGCEYVDIAEQLAIDRVKDLFGAEYANVQPHSGAQALSLIHI